MTRAQEMAKLDRFFPPQWSAKECGACGGGPLWFHGLPLIFDRGDELYECRRCGAVEPVAAAWGRL